MLVTFHSQAWSNITFFGDIAARLLKLMGHSGTVPGALLAADIPAAIARLQQGLAAAGPEEENRKTDRPDGDKKAQPPVTLVLRAQPLIQLLSAAALQECDVMWSEGAPLI